MLSSGVSASLFARVLPAAPPSAPLGSIGPGWAEISALALLSMLFAVALLIRPKEAVVGLFTPAPTPPRASTWAVFLGIAVSALHLLGAALLACGVLGGARGWNGAGWLLVPGLAGALAFAMPFANAAAWRRGWWSPQFRLWYALLSFAAVAFVGLLLPWLMSGRQ